MRTHSNYIQGRWTSSRSTPSFIKTSPLDPKKPLGRFPVSNTADIEAAVASAQSISEEWAQLPSPKKASLFYTLAEKVFTNKGKLGNCIHLETGKNLDEALSEVDEVIDIIRYYAAWGRNNAGQTLPSEEPRRFCYTQRLPIGICGLITPFNFPLCIPAWKLFPALILGNTIILKPSEETPLAIECLFQLMHASGFPAGTIHLLHGDHRTGKLLVQHKSVQLISFTGSSETGHAIAIECLKRHKRYSLEMGGKSATIIFSDADIANAAQSTVSGTFGTSGQRCTTSSKILIHRDIYNSFKTDFIKEAQEYSLGPLIHEQAQRRFNQWIQEAIKDGAKVVLRQKSSAKKGWFVDLWILENVRRSSKIYTEEVFGPVAILIPFSTDKEAISIANETRYGLSSSFYTNSLERTYQIIPRLAAGITHVNSSTCGAEVQLPFGGIKQSGSGHRECSGEALNIYSEWKTVYIKY